MAWMPEAGVQVSCTVVEGQPVFGIVSVAESAPDTLIAMSTHGRTGMDKCWAGCQLILAKGGFV